VPLGSFAGSTYDEATYPLAQGDVFVICSDGVSEAMNEDGEEFTAPRLIAVVEESRHGSAKAIVDAIFAAVETFRGEAIQNDDMTAVAIKITA
jgi:sigma-B regulation protein RsbU (phosphoserine phosphatase)